MQILLSNSDSPVEGAEGFLTDLELALLTEDKEKIEETTEKHVPFGAKSTDPSSSTPPSQREHTALHSRSVKPKDVMTVSTTSFCAMKRPPYRCLLCLGHRTVHGSGSARQCKDQLDD